MMTIIPLLLGLTFLFLSGMHLYWLSGGTWGLDRVIPTKPATEAAIHYPPPLATLIVALGLAAFGLAYFLKLPFLEWSLPTGLQFVYWFIPAIFLIRAIGEFNYVGFFKRINDTAFAKADSRVFSPLCLGIAILGGMVFIFTQNEMV